jgi:hypothetical protein
LCLTLLYPFIIVRSTTGMTHLKTFADEMSVEEIYKLMVLVPYVFLNAYFWSGMRWHSWLRYCAASQKVTFSIPGVVIWIFHYLDSSDRTMALRSTEPLEEISNRCISWG